MKRVIIAGIGIIIGLVAMFILLSGASVLNFIIFY